MKKFLTIVMALAMTLTMFAGCGASAPVETTETPTTEVAVEAPASALEILETIWADYAEDEKFAIIGGNIEAGIMDAPGTYDLAYAENMTYNLLVPADHIGDVAEAASMIHMMNANTFTCGAFTLAEGVTAADFGVAMRDAIQGNQWMCGFPDQLIIVSFGDSHVLAAFGVNDAMNPFINHLNAVYPGCETLYTETIG